MFVRQYHYKSKSKFLDKMQMMHHHAVSHVIEPPQEQRAIFTSKMAALNIFLLICISSVVAFLLISEKTKLQLMAVFLWLHRTQCKKSPDFISCWFLNSVYRTLCLLYTKYTIFYAYYWIKMGSLYCSQDESIRFYCGWLTEKLF